MRATRTSRARDKNAEHAARTSRARYRRDCACSTYLDHLPETTAARATLTSRAQYQNAVHATRTSRDRYQKGCACNTDLTYQKSKVVCATRTSRDRYLKKKKKKEFIAEFFPFFKNIVLRPARCHKRKFTNQI